MLRTIDVSLGAIWWGTCLPHFSRRGDIICHVPPLFLFRFCTWRFKNKNVCHVLCEELFMLDGRPHIAKLILKQSLVSLILLVYEF